MLPITITPRFTKMNAVRRRLGSRIKKSCSKIDVTVEVTEAEIDALGPFIHQAAKIGNVASLQTALSRTTAKEDIDYQSTDTQMRTPLMVAAMNGHLQCVKLLVAHSANIHCTVQGSRPRSQKYTALSLATNKHPRTAEYLQGCIDDLNSVGTTRTHMEAEIISIAEKADCTEEDGEKFSSTLHWLVDHGGYVLEEVKDDEPSLLIRATKANNIMIVHKLVEEFKINPIYSTHPVTAEHVLHYACQNISELRYYFVTGHRELLCIPDGQGNSALHEACAKNDVEFILWLFHCVMCNECRGSDLNRVGSRSQVARSSMRTRSIGNIGIPTRLRAETHNPLQLHPSGIFRSSSHIQVIPETSGPIPIDTLRSNSQSVFSDDDSNDDNMTSIPNDYSENDHLPTNPVVFNIPEEPDDPLSQPPVDLPMSFITDMKLLRKNVAGETILHVLACHGHSELLSIILKVVERIKHTMDDKELGVLTQRDGFTLRTPIEEALVVGKLECVRLLIEFAKNVKLMNKLFEDDDLLKVAVLFNQDGTDKNLEALKMLIGYGFKLGLGKCVTISDLKEQNEVTRLLLYYQTQVINSQEFAKVHPNHTVSLKAGHVKWEGFNLRHIDGRWIHDANCAVESVSRLFHDPEYKVHKVYRHTQEFFCKLGASCLSYFANLDLPSLLERSYIVPLVEINLAENHLTSLPPELFQQRHLRTLRLSHNELEELPTSKNMSETVYSCPRLHKLELDWNQLGTIPEEFCRGVGNSLEVLDLVHNKLTELPSGLWMMRKLKKLKLNHNSLTHLHRFSSPRYFVDPSLSQRVVMLFEAGPNGELCTAEGGNIVREPKIVDKTKYYLDHLMSFLKTVIVLLGKDDPSINLAQEVINIHWQRYNSTDNATYIPRPATSSVIDAIFDTMEDNCEVSPIQSGFNSLEELYLNQNNFKEFPWDLACLAPNLRRLFLNQNKITDLDIVHSSPSKIETLCLSENKIVNTTKQRPTTLPCGFPLFLLSVQPESGGCGDHYCTHCQRPSLDSVAKLTLSSNQLEMFNVIHLGDDHEETMFMDHQRFTSIDIQLLFPNLLVLDLASNLLKNVPKCIEKLTHLSCLNLSGNTAITELPEEMGMLNPSVFLTLYLEGVFIKNIPPNMSTSNVGDTRNIICYLRSIREKSQTYRRIKLMVVGEDNKGKTSLLLSLTKSGNMVHFKEVAMNHHNQPLATNGVELGDWEFAPKGKEKVTFMTWDFGGQVEYYATHQCFLTNRSLFLLVWNVEDGEQGLLNLRFWLENIEVRAKDSPVIVVATHADSLPQAIYTEQVNHLRSRLKVLYCLGPDKFAYPHICSMHVVNCRDNKHMDQLRNYIYNTAVQYCPPPPPNYIQIRPIDIEPLLEQKVPASYIKLQDVVRKLAHNCTKNNRSPIFTRHEYMTKVREMAEIFATNEELDQATSFLHSNGILLHYNNSQLNHLYIVNPQWLCSTLANVITIRERNPHVRDGIITRYNLQQIIRNTTSNVNEIISIMSIFEVIYELDEERLLIPSLLPNSETTPYFIMPRGILHHTTTPSFTELCTDSTALISSLPSILVRYFVLPFTPNGFFPRLIARILNSDLATQVHKSLLSGPLDSAHASNNIHWKCWRNGISLIWNHMEIIRIAPLSFPLPHSRGATIISSLPTNEERDSLKGMEVMVAILPEEKIKSCPIIPLSQCNNCNKNCCMATWLLQRITEIAKMLMEDWYEVFGFRRNLGNLLSYITTPCPQCFKACHGQLENQSSSEEQETSIGSRLHMFTLPFCCLQLKDEGIVRCPTHGDIQVAKIAPDLVFADFAPSALIPTNYVKLKQKLGDGGFGLVSIGYLNTEDDSDDSEPMKVAVKEITPSKASTTGIIPELVEETKSWTIYHDASLEARMMYQLDHPHILTFLGLTLNPIRLVLELAKEDLSHTVARYQKRREKLSRRNLKATLIQVADAMSYLHSKSILYRDLKPGNILVWKFPEPGNQYSPDATVLVKIADYGISKQIGPLGTHGKVGTPQYLPPEVILHSEHEAASLKVDVYGFGMMMYYLFAYKSPFDNSFLIGSHLRNHRRPEMPTKYWPNSVQMMELMIWCWSEKPNDRPSFEQIQSILRSDTAWSLVGGTAVSSDGEVRAACARTITVPHERSLNSSTGHGCTRLASVIPRKAIGIGLETKIEVWYGTRAGKLGVVQFQPSGVHVEEITHSYPSYISSIVSLNDKMWIGSIGCGLWVYDSTSHAQVAVWGETEEKNIYQLIVVNESVLALTNTGMYFFATSLLTESPLVDVLEPNYHCPNSGSPNSVGIYITRGDDVTCAEVWTCAQSGQWIQILSPNDLTLIEEVEIPASQKKKIRHMATVTIRNKRHLFLADRHVLLKYEVKSRKQVKSLDCYSNCWNTPCPSVDLKQARVTSLVAGNNTTLYVGNGAGIILLVNADSMEVMSQLKAYDTAVRCLHLIISHDVSHSVRSIDFQPYCKRNNSTNSQDSTASDSTMFPLPNSPLSPLTAYQTKPSLLTSFGLGYNGLPKSTGASNYPESFILPHGLTPCSCCTHFLAQPEKEVSKAHMLLWSRDSLSQSAYTINDESFDESSE